MVDICTEVDQKSCHQVGSPRGFFGFEYEVKHGSFGAGAKLCVVLTCTDIIKMPNSALCRDLINTVRSNMLVLDVKDATCALDDDPLFKTRLCWCDPCFTLSGNSLRSPPWVSLGMFAAIVGPINRHVDRSCFRSLEMPGTLR